jgi:hypothetical protein
VPPIDERLEDVLLNVEIAVVDRRELVAQGIWKRGQSGNPSGQSGLYGQTMMLARQAAPDAMRRLIELMRSEDERVSSVACNAVLERAFGKPKDYDPADEPKPKRDRLDTSKYTLEELKQIQAALLLMAEDRREKPTDRSEEDVEIIPPSEPDGSE